MGRVQTMTNISSKRFTMVNCLCLLLTLLRLLDWSLPHMSLECFVQTKVGNCKE